jgi:hypothetical protein
MSCFCVLDICSLHSCRPGWDLSWPCWSQENPFFTIPRVLVMRLRSRAPGIQRSTLGFSVSHLAHRDSCQDSLTLIQEDGGRSAAGSSFFALGGSIGCGLCLHLHLPWCVYAAAHILHRAHVPLFKVLLGGSSPVSISGSPTPLTRPSDDWGSEHLAALTSCVAHPGPLKSFQSSCLLFMQSRRF